MSAEPPPVPQRNRSPYHRLWSATAAASVALGCVCGLLAWGTWLWVYAVLSAVMLALLLTPHGEASGVRHPVRAAVRVVAVAVGACGLVNALGWAGLWWVLLVGLAHPSVGRRLTGSPEPRAPGTGTDRAPTTLVEAARAVEPPVGGGGLTRLPAADAVGALDDEALCRAWRRSFVHLSACRLPVRRLELVSLRQAYLDELVRRHPAAVQSWLVSGARAAGNPMPFLERHLEGAPRDGHDAPESEGG